MASYDEAGNTDIARHDVDTHFEPSIIMPDGIL
jgi:hypothetical protein